MDELIVEGITPSDFLLIKKILETYSITIESEISFKDIKDLHDKVIDIVKCLEDK